VRSRTSRWTSRTSDCFRLALGGSSEALRRPVVVPMVFCEQIVRPTRCNWQNSASEIETNSHQSPIDIGLLVSTVLRVIIGKATAITTLISTPRSEDFQSMEASIYANRWPIKLRVCRRRTYRGTCAKFHGAPIQRTPPVRACISLGGRYAKCRCLQGPQTIRPGDR
jgi:hypothetical protein